MGSVSRMFVARRWTLTQPHVENGEVGDHFASSSLDIIFNADEMALYYKLLLNRMITFHGDDCAGGKKSKEGLTVMVCANANWQSG